ncbi:MULTISPECIES: hypothetical protein [Serratia]|uniref:hypothetical protein n=1 Tax=Serratia TaxID=613 RepID=UPI0007455536|nr:MULTISPECIES: hypothetical protein [Serratia]ASM32486.1 hypothetical protein BVG84_16340 [Serratia marcescens]MBH2537881.1 hypothetical protein [Serratia marcescens]MDM1780000.1 hypothetical protein [Serratia marcescens]MDT0225894.1 hypothetical protein [Serratia marcescens]CAI1971905.1 Uncharacterised protein [Serratia marcescens]
MFNVIRTIPAPASLSDKKTYDGDDVHSALQECFHEKCYLCETKKPLDINIEHFDPHMGDITKKFSWTNLYLVCSRCNNIKLIKYKNLLDCCSISVWDRVKLTPGFSPKAKKFIITPQFPDDKTIETAQLLNDIYNNDNTINKRLTARSLRTQVVQTTHKLTQHMIVYHSEDSTDEEKENALDKIKVMIKKSYPYSAFCRWMIKDDEDLDKLLTPIMD